MTIDNIGATLRRGTIPTLDHLADDALEALGEACLDRAGELLLCNRRFEATQFLVVSELIEFTIELRADELRRQRRRRWGL